jgi:hypothetical protein
MILEKLIRTNLRGSGHGLIELVSLHLPGGTEGKHEKPHSE